ncbi:MAG: hypothetical protein IPJ98_31130 [Bryobacterales bacterium]|nr:hypothetical protein [Bryobacterales bacterium]
MSGKMAAAADWEPIPDSFLRDPHSPRRDFYQEAVYFHPFVQETLYGSDADNAAFRAYRHRTIHHMLVVFQRGKEREEVILAVERLHFYLFDTQLAMLIIEVSAPDLPLALAMRLQNQLRRVYPAGWSDQLQDEAKPREEGAVPLFCPNEVHWLRTADAGDRIGSPSSFHQEEHYFDWFKANRTIPASAHLRDLLPAMEPFEINPTAPREKAGRGYRLLGDNRMASMAFFPVEAPRSLSEEDLYRIAWADGPGDWPAPYSPDFLASFAEKHCYDRYWTRERPDKFWMFDTRYLCSGWSWAVVGFGASEDAYMRTQILTHFRHHYFQLGLLAYAQHASLLIFSSRLTSAVGKRNEKAKYRQQIAAIAEDFAAFTDRYWATEVTHQEQGQELFTLWQRNLRSAELYAQVKAEIEFVLETLEGAAQSELNERTHWLSQIGTVGLLVALWLSFLGINPFLSRDEWCQNVNWDMYVTLISLGAFSLAGFLIWLAYRLKDKTR